MFEEFVMQPLSMLYEDGTYDEIPYCANCNLEVGPGGRVDSRFPMQDDYIVVVNVKGNNKNHLPPLKR